MGCNLPNHTHPNTLQNPPPTQHRISLGGLLPTPSPSSPPPSSPILTRAASASPLAADAPAADPHPDGATTAPLTRPQPIRPQLSSSLSSSRLGLSLGAAAAASYWAVFGGGARGSRGGSVDEGAATPAAAVEALLPPPAQQAQQPTAGGVEAQCVAVVSARAALAALEALAGFPWGEDAGGGDDGAVGGLWPEAAAVVAALGPRLLEAAPEGGGAGGDGDGEDGDTMAMDEASAALLFRLRVAGAVSRALRRFAPVIAAASEAGGDTDADDFDEEQQQRRRWRRQRLGALRASVQGTLQALLNAALAEARREGRQALFAFALLVGDGGEGEENGVVGMEGGAGAGWCLDPFLAAPGPVGVLLQAARDEDLEVRTYVST